MDKPEFASAVFTVGQLNALVKIVGPENVLGILQGELKVTIKQPDLLKRVITVAVSGAAKFVASEHLKEANVGWTGDNFKRLFLEKVEEKVGNATIAIHKLEKASLDVPIMAELGDHAEIQLAHFFALLQAQSKGETGVLLVNGYANIAYIRGIDGNFWAVYVLWYPGYGYWFLYAHSVEHPDGWLGGGQVLSRDS
ncbi:MAG: hypothetical protein AAB358_01560 [Patescibacteria group bacterium]